MKLNPLPRIIQGGMGAGVSDWRLAKAVSMLGQLGVVSGTAIDIIVARRLQDGDPGGHVRRALEHFPFPEMAKRMLEAFFIPGGRDKSNPYKSFPMHGHDGPRTVREYAIIGNFVEVFLAKEGHENPVGINYLEKIQLPHLPSLYGAMLAGVSAIIMGAGIPKDIPGIITAFTEHKAAAYPLAIAGDDNMIRFDPREYMEKDLPSLPRPDFIAIISSTTLAQHLMKKANGPIDGFIVEGPTAGGHNAPPRGPMKLTDDGQPIYGPRDLVEVEKMRSFGIPFWMAGGCGTPEKVKEMIASGAAGVQVGTAFALCDESGYPARQKRRLIEKAVGHEAHVHTDPLASPTGFPFKVAVLSETLSEEAVYEERVRICDLGYLREPYRRDDGAIGYRCASEPVEDYVAKKGSVEDTKGRKCLCNALMANIDMGQARKDGYVEPPLLTIGDELTEITRYVPAGRSSFTAADVINYLLG